MFNGGLCQAFRACVLRSQRRMRAEKHGVSVDLFAVLSKIFATYAIANPNFVFKSRSPATRREMFKFIFGEMKWNLRMEKSDGLRKS